MSLDVTSVAVAGTWLRHVPAGADPAFRGAVAASGRWQRGSTIAAVYLAGDVATCWAEWHRRLAEDGLAPTDALPRDLWRFAVSLDRVGALDTPERLARAGLAEPTPQRSEWPTYQRVGEALWQQGFTGVLYASAARPSGRCLCVFRPGRALPGMRAVPPVVRRHEPPPPPRGLRT